MAEKQRVRLLVVCHWVQDRIDLTVRQLKFVFENLAFEIHSFFETKVLPSLLWIVAVLSTGQLCFNVSFQESIAVGVLQFFWKFKNPVSRIALLTWFCVLVEAPLEIKWVLLVLVWPKTSSGISLQDVIVKVYYRNNAFLALVYITSAIAIFLTTFNALNAYRYCLLIFFHV